ncbi:MAG: hypothetical protein SGPRY_007111, partial [Prymnesium sp.]
MSSASLALRVSRPYFWLVTTWLYLLPTGRNSSLFLTPPFWVGLLYSTLPLNLLVYLMNDLSDVQLDAHSARKGGVGTGAKAGYAALRGLVGLTVALQLPFLFYFTTVWGAIAIPWHLAVFLVNWLYNYGPRLSSQYAPLDLFCPCGYMLVIFL